MQSVERHFLPPSTSGRCNLNLFLKRVPIADGKKKKNRTGHTILDASFPPTFLSELKNRKEKRKFSNGTRQMASKKKKFPFFFSLLPFFPSSSNLFWYFPLPTTKSWDQLVKWTHLCCWFVWTSPLRGFYFSDVFGKLFEKKKNPGRVVLITKACLLQKWLSATETGRKEKGIVPTTTTKNV